ncbi:MAG: PAS domain S-box protein [Candidatus Sumerlaeia bacterium]
MEAKKEEILLAGSGVPHKKDFLQTLGYRVSCHSDAPDEILKTLADQNPDVLVVRIAQPMRPWMQCIRDIRERHPLPVLVLYPPSLRRQALEMLAIGADAVSPVEAGEDGLRDAIDEACFHFHQFERLHRQISDLSAANSGMEVRMQTMRNSMGDDNLLQDALVQSEQRYRRILENLAHDHFFYLHDPDGAMTFVSPSVTDILGYSQHDFLHNWRRFFTRHPANRKARDYRKLTIRGVHAPPFELEVFHKDGSFHWLEVREIPVRDGSGEKIAIEGIAHDITERKAAEEALKRERNLFIAGPVVVGKWMPGNDLPLVYVSPNIAEFGFSAQKMMQRGDSFLSLLPEPDRKPCREVIRHHSESGSPHFEMDCRIHCPNGDIRWVCIFTVISRNHTGEITHYDGYLLDITDRKNAEENLFRYAERMAIIHQIETDILNARTPRDIANAALKQIRNLIPSIGASILLLDRANKMACILAADHSYPSFLRPGTHLHFKEIPMQKLEKGEPDVYRQLDQIANLPPLLEKIRDEGVRCLMVIPLFFQGSIFGSLNMLSDQPDNFSEEDMEVAEEVGNSLALALQQAQLYEQTQKDAETKTTLLREVNHRVKNNLVAIMGMMSAEKKRARLSEKDSDINEILDSLSKRVEGLCILHHMLSDAEWKPLLLCELTEKIIQAATRSVSQQSPVNVQVDRPLILVTPARANHFALIVNELATNSIKYALHHVPSLDIYVELYLEDGKVHFAYSDNGPGFPEEVLAQNGRVGNLGFDLIHRVVRGNLGGSLQLMNDGGAKTVINFENEIWEEDI